MVGLHRIEEGRISAVVAAEGSPFGVFGIGESVHEALRHLADELVRQGVWVEVTSRTEWHPEEISDVDSLPEELKADDAPEGAAVNSYRPPPLQTCRGISLGHGEYAGCAYGSGKLRPLTGHCDCPICHGSGYEGVTATWVPQLRFWRSRISRLLIWHRSRTARLH